MTTLHTLSSVSFYDFFVCRVPLAVAKLLRQPDRRRFVQSLRRIGALSSEHRSVHVPQSTFCEQSKAALRARRTGGGGGEVGTDIDVCGSPLQMKKGSKHSAGRT